MRPGIRRRGASRGSALAVGLAGGLLLLGGCASTPELSRPDLQSRVDVDTAELRSAKRDIGVRPCPDVSQPDGRSGSDLPDLALPCLGGGRETTLSDIEGPAVISLWASWCVSCPDELPLFQRLSDDAGAGLQVLGVDYQDVQPGKALSLLELTGAVFPQLADPGGELAEHYRLTGLPAVLLVDDTGAVTFERGRIDSYAELRDLVAGGTGVVVRRG